MTIAQELIADLRSGRLDDHFNIGTFLDTCYLNPYCGTIGCIAGHALMKQRGIDCFTQCFWLESEKVEHEAAEALQIKHQIFVYHLFYPWKWCLDLTSASLFAHKHRDIWTPNWRVDLDTIEKLRGWASGKASLFEPRGVSPQAAANAVEQICIDNEPCVDWMRAIETA